MKSALAAAIVAAGLTVAVAGAATASTAALTGFSGGFDATSGSDQLYGWFFNTSAGIDVDALGVGDADGHALFVSHDVGIYDVSSQNLLVSTTVPSGSGGTLLNGFRYEDITPFHLAAGSYVIVMTMPQFNNDTQSILDTTVTTASPVSYVISAFDTGSSLAFPGSSGIFEKGMFGPNFTFEGGAVPEPSTWALMLIGFGGLGAAMRSRRKVVAA